MLSHRVRYAPLPGASSEAELDGLVAVYRFLVERRASHKAAEFDIRAETPEGGETNEDSGAPTG